MPQYKFIGSFSRENAGRLLEQFSSGWAYCEGSPAEIFPEEEFREINVIAESIRQGRVETAICNSGLRWGGQLEITKRFDIYEVKGNWEHQEIELAGRSTFFDTLNHARIGLLQSDEATEVVRDGRVIRIDNLTFLNKLISHGIL